RRKRPTEKSLPRKIEAFVPESLLYVQMQEFEKRLDATITRKTLDIQDSLMKSGKRTKRTLRVFVSNLAVNQLADTQDGLTSKLEDVYDMSSARIPEWTLKIEGRLIDALYMRKPPPYQPKFSSFFKSVVVELKRDAELYPDGNLVEWHKTSTHQEVDGFEIKRKGDTDVPVRILLHLDHVVPKYKLSPMLASLLDIHTDVMANIMTAMWQYVKQHRLQDADDKRIINCNGYLEKHLMPCDPIVLEVDKQHHMHPQAFDIEVELEDPIRDRLKAATNPNPAVLRDIAQFDEGIATVVQMMHVSKLRRDFMLAFSKDPVGMLNQWIASQSRDIEGILGDTRINEDEMQRSEFYAQDGVSETLFHYLRQQESL
ncbi:hypothetical protein BC831DRAFT_398627, partial [Entophlyctis helioformis]